MLQRNECPPGLSWVKGGAKLLSVAMRRSLLKDYATGYTCQERSRIVE